VSAASLASFASSLSFAACVTCVLSVSSLSCTLPRHLCHQSCLCYCVVCVLCHTGYDTQWSGLAAGTCTCTMCPCLLHMCLAQPCLRAFRSVFALTISCLHHATQARVRCSKAARPMQHVRAAKCDPCDNLRPAEREANLQRLQDGSLPHAVFLRSPLPAVHECREHVPRKK